MSAMLRNNILGQVLLLLFVLGIGLLLFAAIGAGVLAGEALTRWTHLRTRRRRERSAERNAPDDRE